MIRGILLAAGKGTRFGTRKLLHPLPRGESIGVTTARRLLRALPDSLAVIPPDDEPLKRQLAATGIHVVVNPAPHLGMGSSLACGVAATPEETTGWVIMLADMPFIHGTTIRAVADALDGDRTIAVPVCEGRRGHPVGFGKSYRERLTSLTGDRGARTLVRRYHSRVRTIQVDDSGIWRDVDTRSELEHHLSSMEQSTCRNA